MQTTEPPVEHAALPQVLEFALTYNGYTRLADSPDRLHQVVEPVLSSLEASGAVPSWAGVDLLRGALFYVQRVTHHWGDVPMREERHMRELVRAIRVAANGRPVVADYFD